MNALGRMGAAGAGLAILIFAVGCESPAQQKQIEALQQRLADMDRANRDLMGQLAAYNNQTDAERRRNKQLMDRIAALQDELNKRGEAVTDTGDGWIRGEGIAWTNLASDILFDSGEIKLKDAGRSSIREAARVIQAEFADRDVFVVGHTDNDPLKRVRELYKDNLDLSLERGRIVAMELATAGVGNDRIVAGGQGEFRPRAPNDNKQNKALNRRVEIIAIQRPAEPVAHGGGGERG